jgi:hypothetical protein
MAAPILTQPDGSILALPIVTNSGGIQEGNLKQAPAGHQAARAAETAEAEPAIGIGPPSVRMAAFSAWIVTSAAAASVRQVDTTIKTIKPVMIRMVWSSRLIDYGEMFPSSSRSCGSRGAMS